MLVDTHTHLYSTKFDNDREAMLQRAIAAGVERFYLPAIDSETHDAMLKLEAEHPDRCIAMMGLHPCSVKENYEEELAIVRTWLDKRPFVAVGEIGIDLYWDKSTLDIQIDAFRRQTEWAKDLGVPIVIHARESIDILIEQVQDMKDERLTGIFHCYTGNAEQARKITDLGFYLGIGGVVTFKNGGLAETMSEISLDNVVLETDSPYLAPKPYRGKRNESAYVRVIAEKLAAVKNVPFSEIMAKTTANAEKIFQVTHQNAET